MHEKLTAALGHLDEDERTALVTEYRDAILDEAAAVLYNTDDGRCYQVDCCGLHAEDFAFIVRAMRTS
ncbi:hypothetical protein ACIBCB_18205 [Streptomyces uncialis]|uniref:hypothetical protein n=1 Tax=Streptomyces uncialis TaxID=1048205 RepID=UPI00378BD432